ncbi:MAG: hypothetical protein LBR58_09695 [Propionibacteriaceae bacterium]|jgi:chromosome segregation ATPase|nr:hypothetical protein [Propionibacteriaceae bacterium]
MSRAMPTPPGALGQAAQASQMLAYLGELDAWVNERRSELDSLDQEIIATKRQELTGDITLAMTVWQSIKSKHNEILQVWDSGRVGKVELEKLSSLIFGRLDNVQQAMAVSLPEAGRLNDALVASLRAKLNTDPGVENQLARLRSLRASLERIRDQLALEPQALQPAGQAKLSQLGARIDEAEAKRGRGGDIGGLLGPLENDAARFERDLIVGAAQRRDAVSLLDSTRTLRDEVEAMQVTLRELREHAMAEISPVPDAPAGALDDLPKLPNTADQLRQYAAELGKLRPALESYQTTLTQSLSQPEQARKLLDGLVGKAKALGADTQLQPVAQAAVALIDRKPTLIAALRHAVAAYASAVDALEKK